MWPLQAGQSPAISRVLATQLAQAKATVLVGRGALQPVGLRTRLTPAEATRQCGLAMQAVAQTQLHAHVSETVKRRQKHAAEAQDFFCTFPVEWGVSLLTAGPEHVLAYATLHWLPSHVGKKSGPGQPSC